MEITTLSFVGSRRCRLTSMSTHGEDVSRREIDLMLRDWIGGDPDDETLIRWSEMTPEAHANVRIKWGEYREQKALDRQRIARRSANGNSEPADEPPTL